MNLRRFARVVMLLAMVGISWQAHLKARGCDVTSCWFDGEYAQAFCPQGPGQGDPDGPCDSACKDFGFPGGSNTQYCQGTTLWCECDGDLN